jgi:hypothetical protein
MLRPGKRVVIVVVVAALAALAARVAAPSGRAQHRPPAALRCGVERWTVKTLQDRPHLIPAQPNTVAHLVSLTRPNSLPATRLPFERHIYSVIAAVTLVRPEDDQDLHLVLRRGTNQMIAEAPNASSCAVNATAYRPHRHELTDADNLAKNRQRQLRGRGQSG